MRGLAACHYRKVKPPNEMIAAMIPACAPDHGFKWIRHGEGERLVVCKARKARGHQPGKHQDQREEGDDRFLTLALALFGPIGSYFCEAQVTPGPDLLR